jgi:hypothetical protein
VYQGRSLAPDVFIAQEIVNAAGANTFLTVLNTAPGSPGDWALAPFILGPDTNLAFYYRTGKLAFLGQTLVLAGGNVNGAARDIRRYDLRPVGYASAGATLAVYGDHMKAGSTADDQSRRQMECTAIRNDSNALPAGWQFVLGGDFNMESSTQTAYQTLTGSTGNNRGRFFDPISTPGDWYSNSAFRFVHTQAPGGVPSTTGGMDDRFDILLISGGLEDGQGFEYIGNPAIPYSTTTWNDPNHSYRAWGEDGSYFNSSINVTTNAMVGPTIAQAIKTTCDSDTYGGHLPVFLNLRVPGRVSSPPTLDVGTVTQGSVVQLPLVVANGGDVALWTVAGVASLSYSLSGTPGVAAPGGTFAAAAGAAGNSHQIGVDTSNLGPLSGAVMIDSNDPEEPVRVVTLSGTVVAGACYANCDGSTTQPVLTVNDFLCFQARFAAGDSYANCDGSTSEPTLTVNDFLCFQSVFAAGCP